MYRLIMAIYAAPVIYWQGEILETVAQLLERIAHHG